MSFFGFDATLPRDRGHPTNAPGFGQAPDPFAGISRGLEDNDDDAIDFEETYDGLGDNLDETDDAFNDDTFGGGDGSQKPVGKDFDFFGQTAKVSDAINEEQLLFNRQQPPPKSVSAIAASPRETQAKPLKTGYEKYKQPGNIPDLQVNESLWGAPSKKTTATAKVGEEEITHQRHHSASRKKMMSLEEVEAAMRSKKPVAKVAPRQPPTAAAPAQQQLPSAIPLQQQVPAPPAQQPQMIPQQQLPQGPRFPQPSRTEMPVYAAQQPPQAVHRQSVTPTHTGASRPPPPPRQILQNPNRQQQHSGPRNLPYQQPAPSVIPGGLPPHASLAPLPQQLLHLSEEERTAFLIEDAKRAKRNHKIHLLSKDNGLMTPQDKNFITRIQLQQLVTATGNPNESGTDAALMEDFYYQVHNQIRGGPRQNPHQPLNSFAQTYLFRTDGTPGGVAGRRQHRGGDNHMQRMEQQVQRAVEASKARPKNNQLVLEGSLGKISFSNAKTPKPLLNFKRTEISNDPNRPHHAGRGPQSAFSAGDRKSVLHAIEQAYDTLMQIEDHERYMPLLTDGSDPTVVQRHMEWKQKMQNLNKKLWEELKIMDPIVPDAASPHPFIAFLSYAKGKKAIPRIFRHIDQDQRVIILTMIVVFLGSLDVVRFAQLQPGELQLPTAVREEVELFSQAVMPSLFAYVNEAPLNIVVGLLGIIWERVNVQAIAKTKIGLGILTMFFSRGELIRQAGDGDEREWESWSAMYNRIFDTLESCLGQIFPPSINSAEDMYVWQFLAALGVGATPEQQQRLVMAVKDRVMETVNQSKTLPPEMGTQKLGNVNLFMRSIGLDVGLLG